MPGDYCIVEESGRAFLVELQKYPPFCCAEVERFFGDGVEVDASNEATPTAESPRVAAAADGGAKPTEAAGSDPAAATPSQPAEAAAATGGAEDGADAQAATAPVRQAKKECFLKYTHADYGQSKCADRDHRKNVLYQIALADFKVPSRLLVLIRGWRAWITTATLDARLVPSPSLSPPLFFLHPSC